MNYSQWLVRNFMSAAEMMLLEYAVAWALHCTDLCRAMLLLPSEHAAILI